MLSRPIRAKSHRRHIIEERTLEASTIEASTIDPHTIEDGFTPTDMSDSLRDQLLGLGYKPAPKAPAKPGRDKVDGRKHDGRKHDDCKQWHPTTAPGKPDRRDSSRKPAHASANAKGAKAGARGAQSGEMDLGKAYAIRAQTEKHERVEGERLKQEEARLRREARARLFELLDGKALNDEAADITRHFQYGEKIKRIHVTAPQLKALNAGELGVVQLNGRYLLVTAQVLAKAEEIFPAAVALKVDPDAPAQDDPYSDPSYQVPDDMVW